MWEDFTGKLALSCQRKRALGAVKLGSSLSFCNLVLFLASKPCPVGLVPLKIRKVRKKAAVILDIGAYGIHDREGDKVANYSNSYSFLSESSYLF